jgi:phage shock protein C
MEKKLQRSQTDRYIAGVCGGLAEYFGIDAVWVRLAFVLATLFALGGVVIYIVLWIIMPEGVDMPGDTPSDMPRDVPPPV